MCDTTAFTRIKRLRDAAWSAAIAGNELSGLSDTGLLEITRRALSQNNLDVINAAAAAMCKRVKERQGGDNRQPVASEPEPEPAPVVCISADNSPIGENPAPAQLVNLPVDATHDAQLVPTAPEPAPAALVLDAVSVDGFVKEVEAMLALGLSGADIARQWNSEGRRTKKGAEFTGANILRDYRKLAGKK